LQDQSKIFDHLKKLRIPLRHGNQKKSDVIPDAEIERAIKRKGNFQRDPESRTWKFEFEA
jgi:hypothetical protein